MFGRGKANWQNQDLPNLFHVSAPFFYLLKLPKKQTFFHVFKGYRNETSAWNWLRICSDDSLPWWYYNEVFEYVQMIPFRDDTIMRYLKPKFVSFLHVIWLILLNSFSILRNRRHMLKDANRQKKDMDK